MSFKIPIGILMLFLCYLFNQSFFGIVCLLVFATACEEQQRGFAEPPRGYEAQRAVDNDSLLNF